MLSNFNSYTEYGRKKAKTGVIWKFSKGLLPWKGYTDTTSVPIPITSLKFRNLRAEYLMSIGGGKTGAVVGHDFPTWFNLSHSSNGRIMIVAQDPLRSPKWYADCKDAICSSPFGLHSIEWRNNGRGGKRLYLLITKLIESGYGIYLTDLMKFYVKAEKEKTLSPNPLLLKEYADILKDEIGIVKPSVIITLGKRAENGFEMLNLNCTDAITKISMPHFSGAAQGSIKKYFSKEIENLGITELDIETQANLYYNRIIQTING